MGFEDIVRERVGIIDSELKKAFPKNNIPNLYDAVWYHLGTGGKRIRPALAIISCEALGGDAKKAVPFAAACELFHQWLIVHDDIQDGDRIRMNRPSVWVKYGLAHGINIGDLIAQKVYELILDSVLDEKTANRLIRIMVEAA